MYSPSKTAEVTLELFHFQTNTPLQFPPNLSVICIGKPNDQKPPDIDISGLPDSDVASRIHAQIWVNGDEYHITDLGSSNGTYVNGAKLKPQIFCPLHVGDRVSFGQGDKITFMFRVQQHSASATKNPPSSSAPTKITAPTTSKEDEDRVILVSKLIGLGLILAGVTFLSTSIYVSVYLRSTPGILLCMGGVVALNWGGRDNRKLGWVLIGIGIALFIASGVVIGSVSLFSLLVSFAGISCGYQLFTTGKVFNFNPLTLQIVKK
ncbi:FHA domain-containing protein [Nostoc sp. UCD121]|uniref:FHA domain-containing protein n=1 Tax=unclassified Nostoc TaxID=2593658 RepID=UPI001629DC72|nr:MULTISPECIES: FHA domain-containing protein [unclassified Nostoc]MBC1219432.1 FHA domain-containing protein [Nostoc sp. UCD120]MBC1276986.1 FHA domain-containing protein [Nostoc sp. UCD121]MBC1298471.1 FHA domain-containing protein [Nostoc sp. UCD122]